MGNKEKLDKIRDNLVNLALDLSTTTNESKKVEDLDIPINALKNSLDLLKKLYDMGVSVYGEVLEKKVDVEEDINVKEKKEIVGDNDVNKPRNK